MSKTERFKRLQGNRDAEIANPRKPEVIEKIIGDFQTPNLNSNIDTINENTSASVIRNTDTTQTLETMTSNNDNEQSHEPLTRNSVAEQSNVTVNKKLSSKQRIPRAIEEFEKRLKKPTIEETHTRGTWLIRNDLLSRLNKLARHQQRGFKTYVVNYALEKILDDLESR